MNTLKFDEMKKVWLQIAKYHPGDIAPHFELAIHQKLLNIFHVGEYYYYICNIAQVAIEYISENVSKILGVAPENVTVEYIYNHIHPEDKSRFIAFEQSVTAFFQQLLPEQVLHYKVSYDYRIRRTDGSYVWILQQVTTIQTDEKGAVIRVMGVHTDISHLKTDDQASGLSFIGLEGQPSYYNVPVHLEALLPGKQIFSKKEQQVLKYIIEGKNSDEIAEIMFVSIHTVNTHRKNILRKSGCKGWIELTAKAVAQGWI